MCSILVNRAIAHLLIVCGCISLAGCGNDDGQNIGSARPTPTYSKSMKHVGATEGYAFEIGGIRFETPSSDESNSFKTNNGNLTFKSGGVSGTFKAGILTVEGKMYGRIEQGVIVKLAAGGSVTVDGKMRQPLSLSSHTLNGVKFSYYESFHDYHHSGDGNVVINGKSYGKVNKGDEVKQEADGIILVNGEVRSPQ